MKVTRSSRLQVRLQNWLFVILFLAMLGALAWLSTKYSFEADWTAGQRNTITEASRTLLGTIEGPVTVTAFVREDSARRQGIEAVISRYRRFKDDIQLEFVNPDISPDRARQAGVSSDGEVVVGYADRTERIAGLSERSLTNALQRLTRGGERWVVFLEGHGERNPLGEANHDLGLLGEQLQRQGFRVRALNPLTQGGIPDNTTVLVIAGPQVEVLPGLAQMVVEYVDRGGNLLWLHDPGPMHGLDPLAEHLGIEFPPGVVVDTTAQMFGVNDPRVVLVAEYGSSHPVTRELATMTLFPIVSAVDYENVPDPWRVDALLTSLPRSWLETGELTGRITFEEEAGDVPGPLDIGITLARPGTEGEQRLGIIGDGDFLSNTFLNNGGNLQLGLNLFNWLAQDDAQINVHLKSAPDLTLNLPRNAFYGISIGFLIVLPLVLVIAGVTIWLRRRRK